MLILWRHKLPERQKRLPEQHSLPFRLLSQGALSTHCDWSSWAKHAAASCRQYVWMGERYSFSIADLAILELLWQCSTYISFISCHRCRIWSVGEDAEVRISDSRGSDTRICWEQEPPQRDVLVGWERDGISCSDWNMHCTKRFWYSTVSIYAPILNKFHIQKNTFGFG